MFSLIFAFLISIGSYSDSLRRLPGDVVVIDTLKSNNPLSEPFLLEGEAGNFVNASSVSSDNLGNIYVLDRGTNEIYKLNSNLLIVKRNGRQGWREGELDNPTSIDATTSLDVFVTDGNNRRVQRFDRNLNFVSFLATDLKTFKSEFQFKTPLASVIVNSNDIYVLDGDNNRVVVYKDGLNPVNSFGDYQSGNGQLSKPTKIVKDNKNNIFVLDKGSNSVKRFDSFGTYFSELKIDTIISISVFEKNLYILTRDGLYSFDNEKNAYTSRINFPEEFSKDQITGFHALNNNRFIILYKNKLTLWKLTSKEN